MKTEPQYSQHGGQLEEEEIIWLSDPLEHPYLREGYKTCAQRVNFPKRYLEENHLLEIIGYAVLKSDAPSSSPGVFKRRYWFLKKNNDPWNSDSVPGEAVNPKTIQAGKDSEWA